MLSNKIKYTIAIGILLLSVLFFYSSCKKECIQCKTQFINFELVKVSDTIEVKTYGTYEDIIRNTLSDYLLDSFFINRITLDSLYYENYCTKEEINYLKTLNNDKKYCYPH